ncbi:molybdopterin synthase, small subunit CNX7 [Syncephalis plumigaleata]|nr:molybdopterin synthase, small subunit CNX7 [Syncephalis plumigaleata]
MSVIKLLYFAAAHDATGIGEEQVALSSIHKEEEAIAANAPISIEQLRAWMIKRYPAIEPCLQTAVIAINMEYVDNNDRNITISDGDEVAVIPPVSGG